MGANARTSLDPRWTNHHVDVVSSFMLAHIRVTRRNPDAVLHYNQDTKTYDSGSIITVWEGMARVQPYGIIGDVIDAQDTTGRRLMRVQIKDKLSGIELDDMLNIISSPDSPELTQFQLEVRGTIVSSNAWVTDLVCEANLKKVPAVNTVVNTTGPGNLTSLTNLTQG